MLGKCISVNTFSKKEGLINHEIKWSTDGNRTPQAIKLSDYSFEPDTPHEPIPIYLPEEYDSVVSEHSQLINALTGNQ